MIFNDIQSTLNQKDQVSFKQLIKLYDAKQYKKGQKLADKILETNPNHPGISFNIETLSLKGLFLTLSDAREEGLKLCKTGLMKNLKSKFIIKGSLCWHILGIVHRNDKNYIEATKAYSQAYKIDNQNQQISRDLTLLSIQIRDYEMHHDMRLEQMQQNPKSAINWSSFAVSKALLGKYVEALDVMQSFKKIAKEMDDIKPYERSEIILYEATLLQQNKNYKQLKQLLKENEKQILDKQCYYKMQLEIEKHNQNENQQISILEKLLDINSEDHSFIHELYKLQKDQEPKKFFSNLQQKYADSQSIKLIELTYLKGLEFDMTFENYIKRYYIQAKPSLFKEIKSFYNDPQIQQQIESVLLKTNESLEKNNCFTTDKSQVHPGAQLWSYMVLAQHFDHVKKYDLAINYINQAIEHTPTILELYLVRAKIYKHQNKHSEAFDQVEFARNIDKADRYLNNKAIRYTLYLNDTENAEKLIRLFMKHEEDMNIYELQTTWFELAMAQAYIRKQNYSCGLRQFKFLVKQFDDIRDDQFDFHMYCYRKYTLRQYVELIQYENNLINSKMFFKAFTEYIEALLNYSKVRSTYQAQIEIAVDPEDIKIREKLDLDGIQLLKSLDPIKEAVIIADLFDKCDINNQKNVQKTYKLIAQTYMMDKKFEKSAKYILKLDSENSKEVKEQIKQYIENSMKNDKLTEKSKEKISDLLKQLI